MPLNVSNAELDSLTRASKQAAANAYAPYSRYRVGAACLTAAGNIHAGANVENASYGLSICAERVALFRASADGERDVRALVLYTPTASPATPCGACRQVLAEFGDAITVVCCCDGPDVLTFDSAGLLPNRFLL